LQRASESPDGTLVRIRVETGDPESGEQRGTYTRTIRVFATEADANDYRRRMISRATE
jgi:hypothetical protein